MAKRLTTSEKAAGWALALGLLAAAGWWLVWPGTAWWWLIVVALAVAVQAWTVALRVLADKRLTDRDVSR